jgi:hypothetical protein
MSPELPCRREIRAEGPFSLAASQRKLLRLLGLRLWARFETGESRRRGPNKHGSGTSRLRTPATAQNLFTLPRVPRLLARGSRNDRV